MKKLENIEIQVQILAKKLPVIGLDIFQDHKPMAPIRSGKKGVSDFIEALRAGNLVNLATAIDKVQAEQSSELRVRMPSVTEILATSKYQDILTDLTVVAIKNSKALLRERAKPGNGIYPSGGPSLGVILISLYEERARLASLGLKENGLVEQRMKILACNGIKFTQEANKS